MATLTIDNPNSFLQSNRIFSASSSYISQMVDTSRSTFSRVTPIIFILYIYNSVIMVRLMTVAVLLNGHYTAFSQSYFAVDLFLGYLNQLGFLDGYLALSIFIYNINLSTYKLLSWEEGVLSWEKSVEVGKNVSKLGRRF